MTLKKKKAEPAKYKTKTVRQVGPQKKLSPNVMKREKTAVPSNGAEDQNTHAKGASKNSFHYVKDENRRTRNNIYTLKLFHNKSPSRVHTHLGSIATRTM